MSQYVCFYLKKDENYFPVGEFSRNHSIYHAFEDCFYSVYEHGQAITMSDLESIINTLNKRIKDAKKDIKARRKHIDAAWNSNKPADEVTEYIDVQHQIISEAKEYIAEEKMARDFYKTWLLVLDNAQWHKDINENEYLWAGIEWYPNYVED